MVELPEHLDGLVLGECTKEVNGSIHGFIQVRRKDVHGFEDIGWTLTRGPKLGTFYRFGEESDPSEDDSLNSIVLLMKKGGNEQ